MNIEDLLKKRLVIVTGKGGVGKTTVAGALALLNAQMGRCSIIAGIGYQDGLSSIFGRRGPE